MFTTTMCSRCWRVWLPQSHREAAAEVCMACRTRPALATLDRVYEAERSPTRLTPTSHGHSQVGQRRVCRTKMEWLFVAGLCLATLFLIGAALLGAMAYRFHQTASRRCVIAEVAGRRAELERESPPRDTAPAQTPPADMQTAWRPYEPFNRERLTPITPVLPEAIEPVAAAQPPPQREETGIVEPIVVPIPAGAVEPPCGTNYGTKVEWEASPTVAAKRADREHKLMFVLDVSGDFDDPGFT